MAKGPKLSFPQFDGTDPDGWIRKAEKFFELLVVPTEDKVKIVVMYMNGKVEYWWRGTGGNPSTLPWHHFCRMLEDRFEEFMGLVKRNNPSLSEDYFVSSFIARLNEYIQHHL